MKNEIDGIRRDITQLKNQIGESRPILARGYDANSNQVQIYTATGTPTQEIKEGFYFDFIDKMLPAFFSKKRYGVILSGRSAGKSHGAARWILMKSLTEACRILIARETLISLSESMYSLLCLLIRNDDYLSECFEIFQNKITCVLNGSEILFKGLRRDRVENSIKSIEGIRYCLVEESQTISKVSLQILRPSIRDEGSRIIFLINPRYADDAVFQEFVNAG
ncbi:MAG: hypothetical protein HN368_03100 [Spirochaetales bacterium]|jgi:phage terminase large subunit|nr:hypothetical protein [Spirochaetales bacterium]